MSSAPSMPLFCGDYLADTMHLNLEQHGAYLKLLMVTWRNSGKPLADDDATLSRVLGVTVPRWREKIRPAIIGFFEISNGKLLSKRLEKEWNFVALRVEKKRENGKHGGRPKALETKETGKAIGSVSVNLNDNLNESTQPQPLTHKKETLPIVPLSKATRSEKDAAAKAADDDFAEFWDFYPRRTVRSTAEKSYFRARKSGATHCEIMDGLEAHLPGWKGKKIQFVPHASTWLNQRRWEDEPEGSEENLPVGYFRDKNGVMRSGAAI